MAVLDYPRHFVVLVGAPAAALLQLNIVLTVFVALAFAFGAVSYWLLVRRLWAPFLSRGSRIMTIAACAVARLITALATTVVPIPHDPLARCSGGSDSPVPSTSRTGVTRRPYRGGRTWLSTEPPCRSSAGICSSPTAASRPR
jgi:branched-subunit amino acid ABC-type transport system permease component